MLLNIQHFLYVYGDHNYCQEKTCIYLYRILQFFWYRYFYTYVKKINAGTFLLPQSKFEDVDHSDHLYINSKLDEILKEIRHPCAEETDDSLLQKFNQLEKRVEYALNEIRNDISAHTNSLNENRQYATTKFHELRLDVDENFLNANTKLREVRQELKESLAETVKESGTTYTRWGRTSCPRNGSEAVYSGYAGGSHYSHKGAAASMVCLPKDPDWEEGKYSDKEEHAVAYMFGTEYEDLSARSSSLFVKSQDENDVPCVVCNIKSRSTYIVIPGRTRCYPGWTREYSGYLMAGNYNHNAATDYYCIDREPEDVPGGKADLDGRLLYFVEAICGSLRCPPYVSGREFPCVVCSK